MHTSITQILAIAFFALPLVSAFPTPAPSDLENRYSGSNSVMASIIARNPDLLPTRDLSLRHHTEAQIAAKKAKNSRDLELENREAHHTEAQIAAKKAKAATRGLDAEVESREAHHKSTKRESPDAEAEIVAKRENIVRMDDRLERREEEENN